MTERNIKTPPYKKGDHKREKIKAQQLRKVELLPPKVIPVVTVTAKKKVENYAEQLKVFSKAILKQKIDGLRLALKQDPKASAALKWQRRIELLTTMEFMPSRAKYKTL